MNELGRIYVDKQRARRLSLLRHQQASEHLPSAKEQNTLLNLDTVCLLLDIVVDCISTSIIINTAVTIVSKQYH